jgi:hypothetical protein
MTRNAEPRIRYTRAESYRPILAKSHCPGIIKEKNQIGSGIETDSTFRSLSTLSRALVLFRDLLWNVCEHGRARERFVVLGARLLEERLWL